MIVVPEDRSNAGGVSGDVPFSPVLLGGLALRPMPLWLLQKITSFALCRIIHRHSDLADRLAAIGYAAVLIEPTDLPYQFKLSLGMSKPRLTIQRKGVAAKTEIATIRGATAVLLSLLEGNLDGDALFFSRLLSISGDVEVFVALRNAIDAANIDLMEDVAGGSPHIKRILYPSLAWIRRLAATFSDDLSTIRSSLISPLNRLVSDQATSLKAQHRRIGDNEQAVRKLEGHLKRVSENAR